MLITFKSKAAADILMYEDHAKRLLDLLGKDVKQGIITAAETAGAIDILDREIAADRAYQALQKSQHDDEADQDDFGDDNAPKPVETVSFATRAYPLLEMLRAAHARQQDVMWGV